MYSLETLIVATGLVAACSAAFPAAAQYPDRPVKIIVPYATGASTDILARLIGTRWSQVAGQPVVIENRPGGGTMIGTGIAARAKPDGYTLLFGPNTIAVNESLQAKRPYSLAEFIPITLLAKSPNLLVAHPSFRAKTLKETIELIRANPGTYNYASSGVGSTGHLAMEMLKSMAQLKMEHVPYKGGTTQITAVLGNQVPLMFNNIVSVLPLVQSGQLVAIAVSSTQRSSVAPQVPTIAESGLPEFEATAWWGVFAPTGTPQNIISRVHTDIVKVLQEPEVRQMLVSSGAQIIGNSPQEFAQTLQADVDRWRKVIRAANIKVE